MPGNAVLEARVECGTRNRSSSDCSKQQRMAALRPALSYADFHHTCEVAWHLDIGLIARNMCS